MYAALPLSPMHCLSAKVLRPLDIADIPNTPSPKTATCINCPCLQSSLERVKHQGLCEEASRTKELSYPNKSSLATESSYKAVEMQSSIKPTAFLRQTIHNEDDVNPWNINRVELFKCNNFENNNDSSSPQYMEMRSRSELLDDQHHNSDFHKAVDIIADNMAPVSIPSIQVTSPPRSPRPRHRIEMRKKDLSVDKSEVSRLTSDEINHKKLRTRTLHKFTILHYSPFKAVWDWVVLLLVVYTAIFTPYAAAFLLKDDERRAKLNKEAETRAGEGLTSSYTGPLVVIDLFVDIMFVFDIFINFRTTYVDEHKGEVVSDPARIAKHYLKGWFVIDVLAAVPFDLILFGIATDEKTTTTMGLLKTFRLLRLLRVARRLDQYSQYAPAVVLLLMCGFTLAAHWFACMWYAIGEHERPDKDTYGWLDQLSNDVAQPYKNDTTGGPTLEAKYVTSLYFTLTTLTTVGFGNVAPNTDAEKLFAICMMLVGSLMFACIFGNMTAIIERLYEGMARYHQQVSLVKGFVKFHNVPHPLGSRLQEYFKHAWVYSNGNDITEVDEVMKDFPDFLQADISMHLNRNLLNNSAAFRGVNHGCLRTLSMKFVTTHTAPGDILLHRGDSLGNMYFISRGSLEILSGNIVLAILGKNDVVGENFCLRTDIGRSKGTVRALTYCDLLALSREDLMDVIRLYPEFKDHFARKVEVTVDMRDPELDTILPADSTPHISSARSSGVGNKTQIDPRRDIPGGPGVGGGLQGMSVLQAYDRQRRARECVGAEQNTRLTLTPFASTENIGSRDSVVSSHSSSYGFFKRGKKRGGGRGDMLDSVHSIEMGNMAVLEDDENESAGSDVPMLHQQKYRHYSEPSVMMRKRSPLAKPLSPSKSMETHFDTTVHSFPQGKVELGNREAPEGAVTGSYANQGYPNFQPSIIADETIGQINSTAVHRRIDGLYEQLEGLERKFDERKCAIIEVLLGKTVLTSPTSGSNMRGPGYHPMPPPGQRATSPYKRDETGPNEIHAGDSASEVTVTTDPRSRSHESLPGQTTVSGDYISPTRSSQTRLLRREQEDGGFRHSSLPNSIAKQDVQIATDPGVIVTSISHPPQGANPGPDVDRRARNPGHFGRPPRRGSRPYSVPGRIQGTSSDRGGMQHAPSLSFPAGNWSGSEVIWLERKGDDSSSSRLSSTSC